jgi:CubicO group peptidase (beta-lactamase class C family)
MRKNQSYQFLLTVILFIIIFLTSSFCQSRDSLITKVENGLLPVVLIEGEVPFNLEERMVYYNVPGISITVIRDYQIEWTKQYGVMDSKIQNPVTDKTLFSVGSLSKGVAALTVLSLVQEGKIDLNGDINEQLISWKVPENEFTKQGTVTPLLLMNHSGGAMFSPGVGYLPDNFPTNLQVLNGESPSQTSAVVIDKIPGTEYQYSNAGYSILQQLVVDIEGNSFPEVARENIFLQLEMSNSTFQQPLPEELIKFASAGHESNGLPLSLKRYFYPHLAAGGLHTTTSDYAKYIIELQKSYLGKSNKIISHELAEEMLSPHVSKQYGLGVFMREIYGQINYFGHLGDTRGFFAGFVSHLRDGYGAVVFTNSQNGANLIREITNGIAQVYGWKLYLPEEYKVLAIDDMMMDQYCGRYSIGLDGYFEVKKQQNKLFINQFDNAKLFHVGDGKFVIKTRLGYLQFNFDPDQNVSTAVYYFSDELGRFLNDPITCYKMKPGEKVPIELLEEGQIEEALNLYRKIKQENPSDFNVSENRFNSLGYNYMGKGMFEEAFAVLKLNVEFYPESANTYDSLAEAYMNNGDNELAITNYKKSLELNPNNSNAIERLEVLEELNEN